MSAAGTGPSDTDQITYLNGLSTDGTLAARSFWTDFGQTAYKWGSSTAGSGATITYSFKAASRFSVTEKATFEKAFAIWSSVANVTFVNFAGAESDADVLLARGRDGGAYNLQTTSLGSGSTLGTIEGQALISIDTRTTPTATARPVSRSA